MAGVGIEMLSLKPRTEATGENNKKFQVDERITTLSYEAHVKYTNKDWFVGAKSVLGSNLTQASGLGGFGVKSVNERTGEQKYTPIRFSSSWLNVVYGQKWKPGVFVGYAKNLGTSDELYAPMEKHNYMVQVQISTNLSLPEQNLLIMSLIGNSV